MRQIRGIGIMASILLVSCYLHAQSASGTREISISTLPGLQFDKVQLAVKPGEKLKIVFTNNDDMSHNLLIVNPGRREAVVQAASDLAEKGPDLNYIPESRDILWSIPVIYPGQTASVQFAAPRKEGAYPFVCTYPGHGFIMYGVMHVSKTLKIPELNEDPGVPEIRKSTTASEPPGHHHEPNHHPYELVPPYMYRAFMEGSGLASIAVRLPHRLAFCWDADACKLRYAWSGDFLDNKDFWHGHKNAYAKVLGDIFYRDQITHPLRIGNVNLPPSVAFKGYRMVDRYPEFHYLINGIEVFELIQEKADGSGLERHFRIPGKIEPVWFQHAQNDGMNYTLSAGTSEGWGLFRLSPEEATDFTIIMTRKTP